MNTKYSCLLLSALLFSFTGLGQSKSSTYIGTIEFRDVGKFTYQLDLKLNNSNISGYSITNPGLANETKANIYGTIKPDGSVEFMETSILKTNIKDKSTLFCFIDATLTLKKQAGQETLEGKFKGNDQKGLFCGDGDILLVKKATELRDSSKAQIVGIREPLIVKDKPLKTNALSNTSVNKVFYSGKNIKIRVYDSGYLDGDEISVRHNSTVLSARHSLTKEGKEFALSLSSDKENMIEIKTLNEGFSPPNTATIDITFQDGKMATYQLNAPANTLIKLQLISQ